LIKSGIDEKMDEKLKGLPGPRRRKAGGENRTGTWGGYGMMWGMRKTYGAYFKVKVARDTVNWA